MGRCAAEFVDAALAAGASSVRRGGSTSATSTPPGRLRLEALARFLQDVATDDADDAELSEARGVWVLRSSDLEIVTHARVPRGRRARDVLQRHRAALGRAAHAPAVGDRGARRRRRGALGVHRPRARASARRSTTTSTIATASRPAVAACAAGCCTTRRPTTRAWRPWPLRTSDFDVLDHVNNARSLEAVEDELVRRAARDGSPVARADRVPGHARTGRRGDARQRGAGRRRRRRARASGSSVDGEVRVSATVTVAGPGRVA